MGNSIVVHFLGLPVGGVFGRRPLLLAPPLPASAVPDRKIEKLHISVSSTDMSAPELSNSPQ